MSQPAHPTVVLVDVRLGAVLPAAALPVLRAAADVYAAADLPAAVLAELGVASRLPDPAPADCCVIAASAEEPAVAALIAGGATVIAGRSPVGVELLGAVAVMDRLRSPGGCPWDAEQTHLTLRQYLIEETYELLEAIEDGDRPALREELGDVLLQVLFHARLAAEDAADPFTIDEVADGLVGKLVHRHPDLFANEEPVDRDLTRHEHRWEEMKRLEKQRESSVDGVALGQPAVNLAAKLVSRTARVNFPPELLPTDALFARVAQAKLAGGEPEGDLRAVAKAFAADVRAAERAAAAAGLDPAQLTAPDWHKFWPRPTD